MADLTITVERGDEKEVLTADHYILLCFTAKDEGGCSRKLVSDNGLSTFYIDAIRGCAEHLAKDESEYGAVIGQVVLGSIERTEKLIQEKLRDPEG